MAGKSPRDRPHTFVRDRFWTAHRNQIAYSSGAWLRFDGQVWVAVPEYEIQQALQSIIDKDRKLVLQATAGTLNSITSLLRVKCSLPDGQFDAQHDLVTLVDCTLEISTRQRRPFSSKDYITSAFPFAYDPQARSDIWDNYLDKIIPDDCREFLQEFAGYSLTTDTLRDTAVWLYGPAGCGKSTFIEGLRAAFGNRVTTFNINNLEARFGLSHLHGKTLAISAESPATLKQTQVLSQLISGEGVMVEQKYHDPYEMFCRAKFLWAMNQIPKLPDGPSGVQRRVTVIKFAPLAESERDDAVKRQIMLSGQAIFNWALEGLDRLNARGFFVKPIESAHVLSLVSENPIEVE